MCLLLTSKHAYATLLPSGTFVTLNAYCLLDPSSLKSDMESCQKLCRTKRQLLGLRTTSLFSSSSEISLLPTKILKPPNVHITFRFSPFLTSTSNLPRLVWCIILLSVCSTLSFFCSHCCRPRPNTHFDLNYIPFHFIPIGQQKFATKKEIQPLSHHFTASTQWVPISSRI